MRGEAAERDDVGLVLREGETGGKILEHIGVWGGRDDQVRATVGDKEFSSTWAEDESEAARGNSAWLRGSCSLSARDEGTEVSGAIQLR